MAIFWGLSGMALASVYAFAMFSLVQLCMQVSPVESEVPSADVAQLR
jgi:hypothetical protein